MINEVVYIGGRVPQEGETVSLDNAVDTFLISIRTLSGLSIEAVKEYLQKKWEVTEITQTKKTSVVKSGISDF